MSRSRLLLIPLLAAVGAAPLAFGDDDDDDEEEHEHHGRETAPAATAAPGVAPVANAGWSEECGSCHFAYPPGLLPARSWQAIFSDLGHHYGDDATVAEATRTKLLAYAEANAADVAPGRLSQAIARWSAGGTPLRIFDVPHLRHEHDEIPRAWATENPEVKTFANCPACHTRAAEGSFREGEIRIPGRGAWDD